MDKIASVDVLRGGPVSELPLHYDPSIGSVIRRPPFATWQGPA
jgi:hypothetical protein